jgi:hypothetical protein
MPCNLQLPALILNADELSRIHLWLPSSGFLQSEKSEDRMSAGRWRFAGSNLNRFSRGPTARPRSIRSPSLPASLVHSLGCPSRLDLEFALEWCLGINRTVRLEICLLPNVPNGNGKRQGGARQKGRQMSRFPMRSIPRTRNSPALELWIRRCPSSLGVLC